MIFRFLVSFFFILFFQYGIYSQNQAKKWYFGNNVGLDFMTSPPTVIVGSQMSTSEGCSSIADNNGNLLFYTDGLTVWNKNNLVMANGNGLMGNQSSTQCGVIVKQPGNTNMYFVFTVDDMAGPNGLRYSTIDMNLAAGDGSVVAKNVLIQSPSCEKITAVRHCNGVDYWIVSHDYNSSTFRANLLNSTGVSATPVLSSIGTVHNTGIMTVGYMKASPSGKKLAVAIANSTVGFELYDFDNSTGVVSNSLALVNHNASYGVEFSPDGTKLYGALWGGPTLYQWDLCAGSPTAIAASLYTISTGNVGAALQLGPDGKIYMACAGQNSIAVINSPNLLGAACNYVANAQAVGTNFNTSSWGLPNFVTNFLKPPPPPFTHTLNCLTGAFTAPPAASSSTNIGCTTLGFSLVSQSWDFGDPLSGASNTSTAANPTHNFSSLGTFTVTLVMNYSCGGGSDTLRQTVLINQPCVNITSSVSCAAAGSATAAATNGVGPFSYTWMPSGQTGSVATNLLPGNYTVTVYDAGANSTYSTGALLVSTTTFTGNLAYSNSVTCPGLITGTAAFTGVSGGSGNYSYSWNNGTTIYSTSAINNVPAGNYSFLLTDNVSGCTVAKTFTISQPPAITLTIAQTTPTACAGSPIVMTGASSGGTGGHNYSWVSGPANQAYTVNATQTGQHGYTLNVTDANGCAASASIQNTVIAIPVPAIISDAPKCYGSTINFTATGGNSYQWSGPNGFFSVIQYPSVSNVSMLSLGKYSVTAETGGCFGTAEYSLSLWALPNVTGTSNSPVCATKTLALSAVGSSGVQSYNWIGPASFTSSVAAPSRTAAMTIFTGVYTVTATDNHGCTASDTISAEVRPNPVIGTTGATVCLNDPAMIVANGATSYVWSGPAGYFSTFANAQIKSANEMTKGTYTVMGTVAGCTTLAQATVGIMPLPIPSMAARPGLRVCMNENISLTGSGGEQYRWYGPGDFYMTGKEISFTAGGLISTGTYSLKVTDQKGCSSAIDTFLLIDPLPGGNLVGQLDGCVPLCVNANFGSQSASGDSITGTFYYAQRWIGDGQFKHCFNTAGTHTVIGEIVNHDTKCKNRQEFYVTVYPQPKAGFTFSPEKPVEGLESVNFINTSEDEGELTYDWIFPNGYTNKSRHFSFLFDQPGIYPVAMVTANQNGCKDTTVKVVEVLEDFFIYVPDAFTPNGDIHNETFKAAGRGIKDFTMIVFDRWGKQIFYSTGVDSGWDGTFKGIQLKSDVYNWRINVTSVHGKTKVLTGHVMLYR